MNKVFKYAITIVLALSAATCFVLFEAIHVEILPNDTAANKMTCSLIYHLVVAAFLFWLIYLVGNVPYLSFKTTNLRTVLWCLPCLFVALANIPYDGLINGTITITRMDLMFLYILYVISIAVIEEIVFRGILLYLCLDYLKNAKLKCFLSALITTTIFALFHFTNLFVGMDIGSVLLQVLYTFLIGGMLAVIMLKTNNIWICIFIHALFNFGGLINEIADGSPWDSKLFWILTIVCGVLCAGHIIISLINLEKKHAS